MCIRDRVKLDHAGNLHFSNHVNTTGVSTSSNFKTGSSNLHSTGLTVGNALVHSTGINVGTGATVHSPASNVLTLGTNSNERLRIISDGKIGINCTPASQFQVKIGTNQNIAFNSNGSNSRISAYNDAANASVPLVINGSDLRFTISDSEKLRIGSSGQIGLSGANYGSSGQVLTSGGSSGAATWSTVSGTTINNNADNRVITGSGTANTLNAEQYLTWDGQIFKVNAATNDNPFQLDTGSSNGAHMRFFRNGTQLHFFGCGTGISLGDSEDLSMRSYDNIIFATGNVSTERLRITSAGRFGLGTTSPDHIFEVEDNNSSVAVSRDGANAQLLFKSNSVGQAGQIQVSESSGGGSIGIFNKNTSGSLVERVRIHPNGNFYINSTNNNITNNPSFYAHAGDGCASYRPHTGHPVHHFYSNNGGTYSLKSYVDGAGSVSYTHLTLPTKRIV